MTIAIFGDSYADPLFGHDLDPSLTESAWFYHLEQPAVSYGSSGTGLLWSYQQFLRHHSQHEQCVFVATAPWRYSASAVVDGSGRQVYVSGLATAELLLRSSLPPESAVKVKALRDYYIYLQDNPMDLIVAQLVLADVARRRADALIIPIQPYGSFTGVCLSDYMRLQTQMLWGQGYSHPRELAQPVIDRRLTCHFTREINQLLAQQVRQALRLGHWPQTELPQQISLAHDWSYYYSPV